MLKIKIKATGQIIEVKDFSRIIIDEKNEEVRELSFNEVEFIKDNEEDERFCIATSSVNCNYHVILKEVFDDTNPHCTWNCAGRIDCSINEELFLVIAALRDDSNYMQWFIADSILSVSYDDSIGNNHYFTEPKGIMFFWDENWNHETIISGRYHKATVNELIEHFNKS